MDVSSLLSRFERVMASRSRPGTWMARCPAHDDRTPSLGIWQGRNGGLIIRCWSRRSHCTLEEILQAVGLSKRDLFPTDRPEGIQAPWRPPVKRREVARYDYCDEAGVVLFQVCRYEPKSFAQRRPDPQRPGQWLWGLGSESETRRVLYRLPRLVTFERQPVLVVEGERKVHAAEKMGLLATCNAGGTGMGWRDGYSLSLQGRRCVVLPDNDGAGKEHACCVAGSLLMHGAASVRVVMLPGLSDGGDIVDWVRAGGTREQLVEIVKAAPEWRA